MFEEKSNRLMAQWISIIIPWGWRLVALVQNWWWDIFMHGSKPKRRQSEGTGRLWALGFYYMKKHEKYFTTEFFHSPSLNDSAHWYQWLYWIPRQAEISSADEILSAETSFWSPDTSPISSTLWWHFGMKVSFPFDCLLNWSYLINGVAYMPHNGIYKCCNIWQKAILKLLLLHFIYL